MDLRAKYDQAIQTAKRLGFQGAATQEGDKLHFKGTVDSKDEENQIWNAIKTVPDWKNDINADITVNAAPAQAVGHIGQNLHGQGGRYAEQDRQGAPRRRQRLHEDLQRQQGSADRSRQDQARPGAQAARLGCDSPDTVRACARRARPAQSLNSFVRSAQPARR